MKISGVEWAVLVLLAGVVMFFLVADWRVAP